MTDIVISGALANVPDLAEARAAIAANPGRFGDAAAPTHNDIKRLLEWFADDGYVLRLIAGTDGGKINDDHDCHCTALSLQFHGAIMNPTSLTIVGFVKYDVHLADPEPHVHLELWARHPRSSESMKRHLKRAYEAFEYTGIRRITLEAGLTDGPTFWAHAGAQFEAGQPQLEHIRALAAKLNHSPVAAIPVLTSPADVLALNLSRQVSIGTAFDESVELSRLAGSTAFTKRPTHLVHKYASLGIPLFSPRPIGEAILFAMGPWNGIIDLSDPDNSDADFRKFLGIT